MMMKTKSNPRHMMAWLGNSQVTKSGLSERRKEGGTDRLAIGWLDGQMDTLTWTWADARTDGDGQCSPQDATIYIYILHAL